VALFMKSKKATNHRLSVLMTVVVLVCWNCTSSQIEKTVPATLAADLNPLDQAGLAKVLRENRGQVVVLNFWATWCVPCREEFPHLVQLADKYRARGLRLLFVSMDEKDQTEQVKKFLQDQKVSFETFIRAEGDFEAMVNSVDPNWIGAIPATFVFDRQGKRVKSLVGGQRYDDFEKAVLPLL
jgi:thiol-disulfide isomerase/thioredoxin